MLKAFLPNLYVRDFRFINLDKLKSRGIKLLVLDIDNTLVPHDAKLPDENAFKFVEKVKKSGLDICLVSNNVEDRVALFAKPLKVKAYPFAKKPLKITYKKMMKELGYQSHEIAVVGDQLLTDMLGGNRCHLYTILSHPLVERDLKWTKINRVFENMVYWMLEKRKYLKRGVYDE